MILWYILLTPIKGNLFWGFHSIIAEDFICVCMDLMLCEQVIWSQQFEGM